MHKKLLFIFLLLPIFIKAQSTISKKYVDDRINSLTYLSFKINGTFEYRYAYDLIGDFATGHYTVSKDTIRLFYNKDTTGVSIEALLSSHSEFNRADTLIIKGNKLFQIKDGLNQFNAKPIIIDSKTHKGWRPPKSWHYKRKYLIFGPYESTRRGRYYMIEEQDAYWTKNK
jgi:hypothetical protein